MTIRDDWFSDWIGDWRDAWRRGLLSGTVASVLSTLALAACGKAELNSPFTPINGPSQWIMGRHAPFKDGFRLPHTLIGYLIHHSMSILWAVLFERWTQSNKRTSTFEDALPSAAATSAFACYVDYRLTPKRLTPGFEKRLSRTSLAVVYLAFAIGLAAGASVNRKYK